jgi:predicted aspartyl protease
MGRAVRSLSAGFIFFCLGIAARTAAASTPNPDPDVPVQTLRGYLMVVGVTVNDQGPFSFLVDTGTNTTLIDPELAQELKLVPVDRLTLGSMGKSVPAARYFLQGFRVGSASVSHLEALALPLPELRALDSKIRGVLGMNFLLHFSFLLDYEHARLQVFPFPELAHAPAGARLRAEINDWRLLIPVGSNASPRGTWKLTLDSGISGLLVFEDRLAWTSDGLDRGVEPNCHELSIADTSLRDVPVVVLRENAAKKSDPSDGLLPTVIFSSVFFDRTDASVVFTERPVMVAGR